MLADPLDGTRWALEYVNLHGVSHLISGRRIPEISFEDGRVSADDGVNVAEGTYTLAREKLSMDVAAVTYGQPLAFQSASDNRQEYVQQGDKQQGHRHGRLRRTRRVGQQRDAKG